MGKNSSVFLQTEGDGWFSRTVSGGERSAIATSLYEYIMTRLPQEPHSILEVGCSDGFFLNHMREHRCSDDAVTCCGIDPSSMAVSEGAIKYPNLHLQQGVASSLPFGDASFDLLVYGFCLYLCDREDLFTIAAEGNRVLKGGGCLAIIDFSPPFNYKNTYVHCDSVFSYKLSYANMFTWHPQYTHMEMRSVSHQNNVFHSNPDERVSLSMLYKCSAMESDLVDPFCSRR